MIRTGGYYCQTCGKNGDDPRFNHLVETRKDAPKKTSSPWWVEYLEGEYGVDVLPGDESPRDVYKRLHAEEGQSHEV